MNVNSNAASADFRQARPSIMTSSTAVSPISSDQRRATLLGIALMLLGVCVVSVGDVIGKYLVVTLPVGQFLLLRRRKDPQSKMS